MANTKAKELKKESPAVETKTEEKQKLIPYIIPLDPGMGDDFQYFEMCVNGVYQRYPRGKKIELPIETIEFITERDELSKANAGDYAAFLTGNGAHIG